MVFESLVTDVLNRFLGEYVENLDRKQLKLGIWGGDVTLHNLKLKPTALKELDLPIQLYYGQLNKLVVKIPWHNLYGSAVDVKVDGLYVLAVPNKQIEYNEEEEERRTLESKSRALEKWENNKKLQEVKENTNDTFVEKLVTQIVKNVQLSITNIHVRYEDTTFKKPFAMGCTLSNLNVQTTDESWSPTVVSELAKVFYKILSLEAAAIYWNCNTEMFHQLPNEDVGAAFGRDIATKETKPEFYKYILGPINSESHLTLNPKPEQNEAPFEQPKTHAELKIETLAVGISVCQYHDIIGFADSMTMQIAGMPYRKYRPNVPYKGHAKEWWQFAFTCILETQVRRRHLDWSWNHMGTHRALCKEYGEAYKNKLSSKKPDANMLTKMHECERKLDFFNIVLIRQRINLEIEKLDKLRRESEKPKPKSWFGSWFSSSKHEDEEDTKTYLKQFQDAMTPSEKQKLFSAIDYDESDVPAAFPDAYVDIVVKFHLQEFKINIRNDTTSLKSIVKLKLHDVKSTVERRPKFNGIKISGLMEDLIVTGIEQNEIIPELITSNVQHLGSQTSMLNMTFEKNPLDMKNGNRLRLTANPLKVVYDTLSIQELIKVFTPPETSALEDLTHVTVVQLNTMKEKSALGLQHIIEKHQKFDVHLIFSAPIVIIPNGGLYTGTENVLVVNLGTVVIKSIMERDTRAVQELVESGLARAEVLDEMIFQSYDRFRLEVTSIQLIVAQSDEDWMKTVTLSKVSPMHLLNPINVSVLLETCIIIDDPNLPLLKVSTDIPQITFNLTDARIILTLDLLKSIEKSFNRKIESFQTIQSSTSMLSLTFKEKEITAKSKERMKQSQGVEMTLVELKFELQEFRFSFAHQETLATPTTNVFDVRMKSLTCSLDERTYSRELIIALKSIEMKQYVKGETYELVSTKATTEKEQKKLLKMLFRQVNRQSPDFESVYYRTIVLCVIEIAVLKLELHQEGLLHLMQQINDFENTYNEIMVPINEGSLRSRCSSTLSIGSGIRKAAKDTATLRQTANNEEDILVLVKANLEHMRMRFYSSDPIANITINDLRSEIAIKQTATYIQASLGNMNIVDLNPQTLHPIILSSDSNVKSVEIQVILWKTPAADRPDIKVIAVLQRLRISFVYWFVSNILNFLNSFQVAQEAIKAVSEKAAQTAKENMQQIYKNATKVGLDIKLQAPEIIIPERSNSLSAIHIDLGRITINNKFVCNHIHSQSEQQPIIDEMDLILEDLAVDSVILNKRIAIIEKFPILEPLSFIVHIHRNLSLWYRVIPDIDVQGIIENIHIRMGQNDYSKIMAILNGNMNEGRAPCATAPITQEEIVQVEITQPAVAYDGIELATNEESVKTNIKWDFAMHSFVISLYNVSIQRIRTTLSELVMEGFLSKGRILSNNSISNSLLLMNLILSDTRPNREDMITQLLYRTPENVKSIQPVTDEPHMVDVTIQTNQSDTFVDLRVYSFTFILSVEYLMILANFFNSENVESSRPSTKLPVTQGEPKKRSKSTSTSAVISLSVKLEKPDIILVETIDNLDTRALILNCEFLVKLRFIGPKQTISGTLSDFQMYTCKFDPAMRNATKNVLVAPFTFSIAGSTPEGRGLHIEALMTSLHISISVHTIELVNNVIQSVTSSGKPKLSITDRNIDCSDLWNMKKNEDFDFWFLRKDNVIEVGKLAYTPPKKQKSVFHELCIVNIPVIMLTFQAGGGNKTYPFISLESKLQSKISNWSSQLNVEASLAVQMAYYNSLLALWEPFIEPVTVESADGDSKLIPWEIQLDVNVNNEQENDQEKESVDETMYENLEAPQPQMTIDISSNNNLELTITKTSLELLGNMGKLFAAAASEGNEARDTRDTGLFKIINATGTKVIIDLIGTDLVLKDNVNAEQITMENNSHVYLDPKDDTQSPAKSVCDYNSQAIDKYLEIQLPQLNSSLRIPYLRSVSRFFRVNSDSERNSSVAGQKQQWGIVCSVKVVDGINVLTLSSILEVYNSFNIPIDVYYMRNSGNELECIASIQPQTSLQVPLHAVYSATSELFFSVEGYSITTMPYIWRDLQLNVTVTKNLKCSSSEDPSQFYFIKAVGEMKQILYECTSKHTMSSTIYIISLRPSIILKNCLPYTLFISINDPSGIEIKSGDSMELPAVEPERTEIVVKLNNYLDRNWVSKQVIPAVPQPFAVWTHHSHDGSVRMTLDLGLHCLDVDGTNVMSLYCPFWMVNKTGLMLYYRSTDDVPNIISHTPEFVDPILFSFGAKNFFGKKKAYLRVGNGEWCDKFSIDVAGSSGVVLCTRDDRFYEIGVQNELSYNGLTKIITFTPYYTIINQSHQTIECREDMRPADPWIRLQPKSCIAFWPVSIKDDKLISLRMEGTTQATIPFLITESHTTLLKLKNQFGGINVDIQLTEGAVYINLALYDSGMAPAMLINHTKHTMNFWEKKSMHILKLPPNHNMFFTWDYPSSDRVLVWEGADQEEIENELRMDDVGNYRISASDTLYWISFLDGMQRIILFTFDAQIAENAQSSKQIEIIEREINLSLNGVGLSIVNNLKRQEILYVGITSTGIIWETCKRYVKRYKQMSTKDNIAVEKCYQQYLTLMHGQSAHENVFAIQQMEIDFAKMQQIKPRKRFIRRRFQTGIWVQLKTSQHQMQLHAKINRLQIDNQLYDCTFPVLLAPVPPPKSVVATDANKPFAELSIVQLLIKNSQIRQYKYFKVLIQEFHVKVDLGFVNALMEVFITAPKTVEEEKESFRADIERVYAPLYSMASQLSIIEQKSFYDLLHFSPLKIHVSFSMSSGQRTGIGNIPIFLGVLLQSIGVTLTDVQDVVFKLAYFQREYTFLTQRQLVSETSKHYLGQTVKQCYVLVLGLDVIGNPYGLVLGITKGVEDLFYEPFQGAIQGPSEFAEGLAFGVASLFGHTLGGAAGAVSRITGAVGKGIAALSFDKEFQRKRRDQMKVRPTSVREGIARSSKGLVMGVVDGVTGVFTKPISGAKERGVGGFFKGLGKGAVGLVTRPTAGVMDFASSSFESVKRVTEFGAAYVTRIRPARFVQTDRLVKPYNLFLASGNRLLCELEKGKYYTTDVYVCHFVIIEKKEVLLLSDKRLAYITHNDLFGGWQVDWTLTWNDLQKEPSITPQGVEIHMESSKRNKSKDHIKIILIADERKAVKLIEQIKAHMNGVDRFVEGQSDS